MYLRIDGPHEDALERLGAVYGEKTSAAVVRQLIRQAAVTAGVWPTPAPGDDDESDDESEQEMADGLPV